MRLFHDGEADGNVAEARGKRAAGHDADLLACFVCDRRASNWERIIVCAPAHDFSRHNFSRVHARVQWRQGAFVLTDLSSFGTWVRFEGSDTPVQLRRDNCLLHGTGEIALGVPFAEGSAPIVSFQVFEASMCVG